MTPEVPLNQDQLALDDLQLPVEDLERRPVLNFRVPAKRHYPVRRFWRVLRTSQKFSFLEVLDDLLVGHAVVRLQGQAEDLPPKSRQNSKVAKRGRTNKWRPDCF